LHEQKEEGDENAQDGESRYDTRNAASRGRTIDGTRDWTMGAAYDGCPSTRFNIFRAYGNDRIFR
jgi:hypothetical protein